MLNDITQSRQFSQLGFIVLNDLIFRTVHSSQNSQVKAMGSHASYEPLHCDEGGSSDSFSSTGLPSQSVHLKRGVSKRSMVTFSILVATLAIFTSVSSYLLGKHVQRLTTTPDWSSPPGHVKHNFNYRRRFGVRPSKVSQKYWDMVFPRNFWNQHWSLLTDIAFQRWPRVHLASGNFSRSTWFSRLSSAALSCELC
ncbi:hypothetical protein F4808DRAFT_401321 [Astrocystis sublimbata]|nr:hypothetical protein F4808DRAFT_401321 [Astrocystis sublimbata]